MEPALWFIGIMVVLIVISAIQNFLNPPRDLEWSAAPAPIREAVESLFPDLLVSSTRYIPVARKYKMLGQYRSREVEVEVECNKDDSIREIELEDRESGQLTHSGSLRFEELPEAVTETIAALLGPELETLQISRLSKGNFNSEVAYKLNGRASSTSWEIEITEAARLIEVEVKLRR